MKKIWEFTGICAKMFLNSSRKLLSGQKSGKGPIKTYHAVEVLKIDDFDIISRRQALSQVKSNYDLLGLGPLIVKAETLMRKTWNSEDISG